MGRRVGHPRPQDAIIIRYRCVNCSAHGYYFSVWGFLANHIVRPPATIPCDVCPEDKTTGHRDPLDAWTLAPDIACHILSKCLGGDDGVLNDYRPAPIELIRFKPGKTQPDDVREWWQQS